MFCFRKNSMGRITGISNWMVNSDVKKSHMPNKLNITVNNSKIYNSNKHMSAKWKKLEGSILREKKNLLEIVRRPN